MNKKESFVKRTFKGIGTYFLGEIMCFCLVLTLMFVNNDTVWIKIIISVCGLAVQLGLWFNWTYDCAKHDKSRVKLRGDKYDKLMPVKMALVGPIITYICLIALFLSKIGVIPDIFSYYLLLNLYILPVVNSFTTGGTIDVLNWLGYAGIVLLVLLQPAMIIVTYKLTYNEVDVLALILYNKNKKD